MKISEFNKKLNAIKRKHGDLELTFDDYTVDPNTDEFQSISGVELLGVFKIRYEDGPNRKRVVLGKFGQDSVLADDKDLT